MSAADPQSISPKTGVLREALRSGVVKFIAGIVVAILGWLAASALGLIRYAVGAADAQSIAANLADNEAFVSNVRDASLMTACPIGAVVAWPSTERVPEGWHPCDGTRLPLDGHGALASALKSIYARADNGKLPEPGEIQLPNFTGCFLRGLGGKAEEMGKKQGDAVGEHPHAVTMLKSGFRGGEDGFAEMLRTDDGNATPKKSVSLPLVDRDPPSETRPTNYAVQWIIRIR